MTESLKKKTASSLIWNALDKAGFQLVALIVGIITARLLSPRDFGLIGALVVFTLLSNILVESGFTSALIRRKKNTDAEYTAILYFNVLLSAVIYLLLFISAPKIADFFKMPELCSLARFLFLSIIINSLGIVQNIVLTKELAFRLTSLANITSAIVSGIITIILVLKGFEYWALAWQLLLQSAVRVVFLWMFSSWKFSFKADFRILKEVFSFSVFLLITSLITTLVKNVYNILIGRFFPIQQLGYYYQANKFQQIPSNVISMTLSGVAYPVFSKLNAESERQVLYLRKIMRITSFLIFPVMIGLLSLTNELVTIVLTDKWLPAVPYFRLLVLAAIIYPLHMLNMSYIIVKGYPKMSFWLEMVKNGLILISLFFCMGSIELMMIGFSVASLLSYGCDLFFVQKNTNYKAIEQLKDILPYALISAGMFVVVKFIGMVSLGLYTTTILQLIGAIAFYFITIKLLGSQVLNDAIAMVKEKSKL